MAERASWGVAPGAAFVPGRVVLRSLGGGSRYEVFEVWDDLLQTTVVVKAVRPDRVGSDRALAALGVEAAMLTSVGHPNIVRLFDARIAGERPHMVLEHHVGLTLRQHLRTKGKLAPYAVASLVEQIAAALHTLARADICHLDVKPSNIIMGSRPILIDLSIARSRAEAAVLDDPLGTGPFMAPEQIAPGVYGRPGPATDVWGLGMCLATALAGRRPFPDPDPTAPTAAERYPQLNGMPERVGGPFGSLVEECLRKDPDARPSAAEVRARASRLRERILVPQRGAGMPDRILAVQRAVSSAEEHCIDVAGVRGSIPLPPTERLPAP